MHHRIFIIALLVVTFMSVCIFFLQRNQTQQFSNSPIFQTPIPNLPTTTSSPSLLESPETSKSLSNDYHVFQTFNNCGPAALSMALSYYDVNIDQQTLGRQLRPYQHPTGDNDDKSVTLEEVAREAEKYGLLAYHRPNGDIEKIKLFIHYDLPVITRTWLKVDDDIGHYRVVKGYDDSRQEILQDDSLQNKNLWFSYDDFLTMWGKFSYEYVVLVLDDKKEIAEAIIGEDLDEHLAWQKAADQAQAQFQTNPEDITAGFNLSVAYYHLGAFEKSVAAFEQVETKLPSRTLWYQIEPILAYYELGNYQKVFYMTDQILNNNNRAFSELYIIRGNIYKNQGNIEAARREYELAVRYNENLEEAKEALESLR